MAPRVLAKQLKPFAIAHKTQSHFERINAVASNVEEMRKILAAAQNRRMTQGERPFFSLMKSSFQ